MIYLKTDEEIELMRVSNLLVGKTLAEVAKAIKPGVSVLDLDKIAFDFIKSNGAEPSFLGYNGFPNTLCISINDVVVHGIPSNYVLKEGDIVSVDCGVKKNGFHGDSCYTFCCGEVAPETRSFLKTVKDSLMKGIEVAVEGKRIGDIGNAIQTYCESAGYSVVREMVGHGIGRNLHEEPAVPNYGKASYGKVLKSGMVIAIEPMINMGAKEVYLAEDQWGIYTADKSLSAHYEHTVAIRRGKADILSSFEYIEQLLGSKSI